MSSVFFPGFEVRKKKRRRRRRSKIVVNFTFYAFVLLSAGYGSGKALEEE
jgi:hypothetical protein